MKKEKACNLYRSRNTEKKKGKNRLKFIAVYLNVIRWVISMTNHI